MDTAVRDEWVAALRSGDYSQGGGVLRKGDSYCCLGVLCDLAVKHDVIPAPIGHSIDEDVPLTYRYGPDAGKRDPYSADASDVSLPRAVMDWAGLAESLPSVELPEDTYGDRILGLASLNDAGRPFSEIAGLIEKGELY